MSKIPVGFGSATGEFKSKYPSLHMPARRVADSDLVNPGSTTKFLDFEWGIEDATTRKISRPLGNTTGLDDNQTAPVTGVAGSIANLRCRLVHGNPGRSDRQYGITPFIDDEGFEILSKLHDGNRTGGAGTAPAVGDVCHLIIADVTVNGLAYTGRTLLAPLSGAGHYVARCVSAPDADGWARFFVETGYRGA